MFDGSSCRPHERPDLVDVLRLTIGKEDLRALVFAHGLVVRVLDEPDDFGGHGRARVFADADVFADRIGPLEVALHERLVHDRSGIGPSLRERDARVISFSEAAASHEWNTHGLEIPGTHGIDHRACAVAWLGHESFDREAHPPSAAAEQRHERIGDPAHAGKMREPLTCLLEEGLGARTVVAAASEVDAERDQPLAVEPQLDIQQLVHAADEESGADEQGERQRDLCDDERLPQTRLLADDRTAALLSVGARSIRALRSAGTRPASIAVATARPDVKSRMRPSGDALMASGLSGVTK